MRTGVLHILDGSCDADGALEAGLLAGSEGRLVCIGPPAEIPGWPGAYSRGAGVRVVGLSAAGNRAGRLAAEIAGAAVARCWSPSAACAIASTLAEGLPLAVRLSAEPSPSQAAKLFTLVDGGLTGKVTLVCPSDSVASGVKMARLPGEVAVVPPPAIPIPAGPQRRLQVREQLGIAAQEMLLAAPGQVHGRSGHRLAVWATAILTEADYPVRLAFQHTGQEARDVANFAREAGFGAQIVMPENGFLTPDELLSAADLAIFLGEDSLPGVALATAVAAGLPIVASDIPAARDWLADGKTALLVRAGVPRLIAQAVFRLIEEKPLAADLGAGARASAGRRFDLQAVRRQWRQLEPAPSAGAAPTD